MGCDLSCLFGRPRTLQDRMRDRKKRLKETKLELVRRRLETIEKRRIEYAQCVGYTSLGREPLARAAAIRAARLDRMQCMLDNAIAAVDEIITQLGDASNQIELGLLINRHAQILFDVNRALPGGRALASVLMFVDKQSRQLDAKSDVTQQAFDKRQKGEVVSDDAVVALLENAKMDAAQQQTRESSPIVLLDDDDDDDDLQRRLDMVKT